MQIFMEYISIAKTLGNDKLKIFMEIKSYYVAYIILSCEARNLS